MARLSKQRAAVIGSAALLVGWVALNAIVASLPGGAR